MRTCAPAALLGLWLTAAAASALEDTVESGFVETADAQKIHYVERGRVNAILFVPGWSMTTRIWKPQLDYFSESHRVVAMDPRSQGQSSKALDGHYPAARARDIKAVVDQLDLAPVVLVGWSMAVNECAAYVEQFGTDTLAGLVLVDGGAGVDEDPQIARSTMRWAANIQKNRQEATDGFVRSMYKKPHGQDYLEQAILDALMTPTSCAVALIVGNSTSDHRGALETIDVPTLITVAPSRWMATYEEMAALIPDARLEVFEGAGHAFFVDCADRFNELVDEFLVTAGH